MKIAGVLDAAAVLLLLDQADDNEALAQRRRCLDLIRKGEAMDGAWGRSSRRPRRYSIAPLSFLA